MLASFHAAHCVLFSHLLSHCSIANISIIFLDKRCNLYLENMVLATLAKATDVPRIMHFSAFISTWTFSLISYFVAIFRVPVVLSLQLLLFENAYSLFVTKHQ